MAKCIFCKGEVFKGQFVCDHCGKVIPWEKAEAEKKDKKKKKEK